MSNSDNKIYKVLRQDSLAESEKIFGKSVENFDESEQAFSFLKFQLDNQRKEEVLKQANDTYFSIDWKSFISLIESKGFKLQSTWIYDSSSSTDTKKEFDRAVIYEKDGMLIFATSYGGEKSLNGGNMYCECELKPGVSRADIKTFSSGGYYDADKGKIHSYYDIRQGLFAHIRELEEKAVILPIFESKSTHPWLATYADEKRIDHDFKQYDEVRKKRILESSERIKALCSIITDEPIVLRENTYSNIDIRNVNLTQNISAIESGAFKNCPNLESITIASDVTIPLDMIQNCPKLKSLNVHGVEVPLNNGFIKDNTLTGLLERMQDELNKDRQYINDILKIREQLEKLYDKNMDKNKTYVLSVLNKVLESADMKNEYMFIRIKDQYDLSKYGDDFSVSIQGERDGDRTKEAFVKGIKEIIEKITNDEISSISISADCVSYDRIDWNKESKQSQMIRKKIEKIDEELKSMGISLDNKNIIDR